MIELFLTEHKKEKKCQVRNLNTTMQGGQFFNYRYLLSTIMRHYYFEQAKIVRNKAVSVVSGTYLQSGQLKILKILNFRCIRNTCQR